MPRTPAAILKELVPLVSQFEAALQTGDEEEIQKFIASNSWILEFRHHGALVIEKYRIADVFVTDFLVIGREPYSRRIEPLAMFVEIERANQPLFTKSGDPTSFLTHAIRQVQDWKRWVKENRSFVQSQLQHLIAEMVERKTDPELLGAFGRGRLVDGIRHGFHDCYVVMAGRRDSMTIADRIRLTQMNDDLDNIMIITFDTLIEGMIEDALRSRGRENDTWDRFPS